MQIEIVINGRLEFTDQKMQCFNRDFTAILKDSPAFKYGNNTCVVIVYGETQDGQKIPETYIDTRYDCTLNRDKAVFERWLRRYFSATYTEHILTFRAEGLK